MKLPQLSLRDLFLLVTICALAAGWWREHRQYLAAVESRKGMWPEAPGEYLQVFVDPTGTERFQYGSWGSNPKRWPEKPEDWGGPTWVAP